MPPTTALPISTKQGFTFIEMLVVTIIIVTLTAIVAVSFSTTSEDARDTRRRKDLGNLQVALENYKLQFGEYPEALSGNVGCDNGWSWPECNDAWIVGMEPEFMEALPTDPRANEPGVLTQSNLSSFTYNYQRPTPTTYRLRARLEEDSTVYEVSNPK